MFSIDGLVSGLDTTSIIEGLVSLQQAQVDRLNERKAEIVTRQTAFRGVEARVISLRSTMSRLNRSVGSVFELAVGTSSDESRVLVEASNGAAAGTYNLEVLSLAKAHQVGSQSIPLAAESLTEGELVFQIGNRPPVTLTVDETNNSLEGLVAGINQSVPDLSASLINDQANGSRRILLTADSSGAANEIVITNNLSASTASATRPDFSGPAVQDATNAQIQLGSGAGAIVAEYESNQVEGLIAGVSLDLLQAEPGASVTIAVRRDSETAVSAIKDFVDEYNGLMEFIDETTRFDTTTNTGGPLLGNRSVASLKNALGALVTEAVPGLSPELNRLSQLGIQIDARGALVVNEADLKEAVESTPASNGENTLQRLFGLSGSSDHPGVEFVLGSSRTQASPAPYQVDIEQAAERARIVGDQELAASITIDATNRDFVLSINGLESGEILLGEGIYTPTELAAELQAKINSSTDLPGSEVSVTVQDNRLELTSLVYGSSSQLGEFSGSALDALGLSDTQSAQGKDVVGRFLVDGEVELATGTGRILVGDQDNENTADLQVRVTLGPDQVVPGVESELQVTRGITGRIDQYFGELLRAETGLMANANEDFGLRIESLDESIARVNAISEAKTQYLVEQFTALERVLSDLQSTSSFVSSQLQSLG